MWLVHATYVLFVAISLQ